VDYIEKCINSIIANHYPKDLVSIYVCDGMSNDGTRELIKKLVSVNNNLFLLDNHKKTTPLALNLGLKTSTAEVKIILGAHSEVDENFISENINALDIDPKIGCVGGILENVYENQVSKIIGLAMSSKFGVGNAHFRTGEKKGFVDTVAFGGYRKEVFNKVGYFDETLERNQDDEFNFRVVKSGYKIYLSEKIKCNYYVRASYTKLYRQYYQYGYWKVFVNKKHRTITSFRQLVPLFFVFFLITALMFSLIFPYSVFLSLFILFIYFFLSLLASYSLSKKISTILKTSFVFLLLHSGYGWGYLLGLIDFIIFNKKPNDKATSLTR
jgi:GT2 family glycosyltransferase